MSSGTGNPDALAETEASVNAARTPKRIAIPFDVTAVRARLATGVDELKLSLSRAQMNAQIEFLKALHAVNQIHNLTAIRDPLEMVSKHTLDSLSVLPFINTATLVDVGSGGGVPGFPLLLAGACKNVVLIDSVGKKMRAMTEIAAGLGVSEQLLAMHSRIEEVSACGHGKHVKANAAEFSACRQIIARAFGSLASFCKLAGPMLAPGGELLAMKGSYPQDEIDALPKGWVVAAHHSLAVPFVEGERCLVVLTRR
jgi:16S rRNA (guanine527-N7)-methyltransferase